MHRRSRAVLLVILIVLCYFPLLFCGILAVSYTTDSYYPSAYALIDATSCASGNLGDLQTNDGAYMTFQSYPSQFSPRSLYAHQETTTISGADYYISSLDMADMTGTNLSASLSQPERKLLGEFIYPLTTVTLIPSSTWTFYYRAWLANLTEVVSENSPSWVPQSIWQNAEYAYSSNDTYAYSSNTGSWQQYGNYGFDLPSAANITKVELGYEAYAVTNEGIRIGLSWDGGTQWTTDIATPSLGQSDPNATTWVDFTAAANWNASMFSDANFRSRVQVVRYGYRTDDVFLDWLPVKVTYISNLPSVHLDADVCIRRSDGTIRQTLAIDVANSGSLSRAVQTCSGTYSWPGYIVVAQTDYLEIDYYVEIQNAKLGSIVCLNIDDSNLVIEDQTRVANIMISSEFTAEVELSGNSNINDWLEVVWIIDSSWTTDNVLVTLQLYDYSQGSYPTYGDGYIAYQSNSIPNTDETKTQTVTANATDFRDYSGNWKMRIKGTKPATLHFNLKLDLDVYQTTTIVHHDVAVLSVTYSPTDIYVGDAVLINVTLKNGGDTPESFNVTVYYDENQIAENAVTNLMSNESIFVIFKWNTTGTMAGAYVLKAVADTVPNEDSIVDNSFTYDGFVNLIPAEDNGMSSPPWNWTWALLGVPLMILFFAGIAWKGRKRKLKPVGIEFLNEITEGGIPDSFSVMLVGSSDSGKSILFQELAYAFLEIGKPCVCVVYECFPDEIRESMKKLGKDTSTYESQGKFSFIDCFSSSAKVRSKEKHFLNQPFSLVDLGILISKSTNDAGDGVKVFLDSITPLFAQLHPSRVIDFLQDRIARVKGVNGNLVFTLNKESIDLAIMSQLEETVDCIIELEADQVKGEVVRRLRVKKMRGKNSSDKWVPFEIDCKKGFSFLI